jgi:hypothetical protein
MILQENVDLVTHLGKFEDFWFLLKKIWMAKLDVAYENTTYTSICTKYQF